MNLSAIRDGLAARLATITGLRVYDTAPDKPETPAAVVLFGADPFIDYLQAYAAGLIEISFEIRLIVKGTVDRAWQDQLDEFLSAGTGAPSSVLDAIAEDPTLGGTVNKAFVHGAAKYGTLPAGPDAVPYGTATLLVTAHVPRT